MTSRVSTHTELTEAQRRQAATEFSEIWQGRGYEKGDTATFWNHLLGSVVGMEDIVTSVRYEERTDRRGFIDVVIADAKTIIEQKSWGLDLDKPDVRQGEQVTPFQQAFNYANALPNSQRPDYIIVCNFQEFRIHDLDRSNPDENYLSFTLEELPEQYHLLNFLTSPQELRRKREEQVSMDAGQLIGRLYQGLREQYIDPDSEASQHALNVLCVRLVFCLFAEDAGLFGKDAFYHFLKDTPAGQIRTRLFELFEVLDTPVDERDPYLADELKSFPYVNGGLFSTRSTGRIEIPNFTDELVELLVEEVSRDTNWSEISPTIFGGVFESTLNPETRAAGGMHYTSPENIHKVIDPLFLDDLKEELAGIIEQEGITVNRRNKMLNAFHDKLASLTFFDPACGSGNFLTETYISLRRIENKILSELANNQTSLAFDEITPLKISLDQFYGLEINDFAVSVASTALWIAQLQANIEAQTIITQTIDDLPLTDAANIHHGNALRTDWAEVVEPADCDYIIGNPPFLGARNQSKEQKEEVKNAFPAGTKNVGNIDYVAAWFIKAAVFSADYPTRIGFVATNSVVQGEQVANIWYPITQLGFRINFAHNTFRWINESTQRASVFCVIVGFSKQDDPVRLFHYEHPDAEPELRFPSRLNPYLADGPDVFVWNRTKPLCDVPTMGIGSQPIDDGNFLFTPDEKEIYLGKEPHAEKFMYRFMGSREFINGIERWVLWLGNATGNDFKQMPLARERVENVRQYRLRSKRVQTKKAANKPNHFGTEVIAEGNSIAVPEVSSQRRKYVPVGFIPPTIMCSNKLKLIPDTNLFLFGLLQSQFHNAWMRVVGGRLKSDFSYSSGVVYNNFVFPEASESQREAIEHAAQAVLDARGLYSDATLAELYDPDNAWLYPELTEAHGALDRAVEAAYGVDFSHMPDVDRENAIVNHLFELYAKASQT